MRQLLEGKTVLITGSARGIGAAAAKLAKAYGATVILHGRTKTAPLEALAKELGAEYIVCDAGDKAAVEASIGGLLSKGIAVDVLINSAGMAATKPFLEADDENWQQHFQVNVLGTVHFCQAIIPGMLKRGTGRIVNIASIRGHDVSSSNRGMAYSVSKAAIVNLTATLAKEYAPIVAVNAVSPGFTQTDMSAGWNDKVWAQAETALVGRVAQPQEIAEAALFLASEKASFITGQTLVVDGGYTLSGK